MQTPKSFKLAKHQREAVDSYRQLGYEVERMDGDAVVISRPGRNRIIRQWVGRDGKTTQTRSA